MTIEPGKNYICPLRRDFVSFQLVDEHGNGQPYAGLAFELIDRMGESYKGKTNSAGKGKVENIFCGPATLSLKTPYQGTDDWYNKIAIRDFFPLEITELQYAAESSSTGPTKNGKTYKAQDRATAENAQFYRVEVRDFVEVACHLPDADTQLGPKPALTLKLAANATTNAPGVGLEPNRPHILEVKALRALSPLLSLSKEFCALNNYHLAVMSAFSYAPFNVERTEEQPPTPPPYDQPGSIGHVLQRQWAQLDKATLFETAGPYDLLYEEVPYSKRLEVLPYDPERYIKEAQAGWEFPELAQYLNDDDTDTQGFITHNDKIILFSARGTATLAGDVLRDLDAAQVAFEEGAGQAHRGFYNAFLATKKFINDYLTAFYSGQTLVICGHSLGGAIATLVAEWLRRERSPNVILYTYGSPRTGDKAFVEGAKALTHHRIVNNDDPIPGVPFTWMDSEWKMTLPGSVMLIANVAPQWLAVTLLLSGLLNLEGDNYQHHGEQRFFMPRVPDGGSAKAILWQPGCAALDEQKCALKAGAIDRQKDVEARKSLAHQVANAGDHSSNTGYSRAALTHLLRTLGAVNKRNGALFTQTEFNDIDRQVDYLRKQVTEWKPATYQHFQQKIRLHFDSRFYGKTNLYLLEAFHKGDTAIRGMQAKQIRDLEQASQRLLAQGQRTLSAVDVFGDLAGRADLPELVNAWSELKNNRRAESLALEPSASRLRYV